VLTRASGLLRARQQYDSAYILVARAAQLDPRSANTLMTAAYNALTMRRPDDAIRYANALIPFDSTDERAWLIRAAVAMSLGDTTGVQRELAIAEAVIPRPSIVLLNMLPYASDDLARRFLTLSARELGVASLSDSVFSYLDVKADACARLADAACERVYYDSIATLLVNLLSELALADAALGRPVESRRTLDRLFALRKRTVSRPDGTDALDATVMAGTYARLGQPDSAVSWLERSLAKGVGQYTAQSLALNPKLRALRDTPAFELFLRAHSR
jgi:tetratricopeptide (TPR) repeat protein